MTENEQRSKTITLLIAAALVLAGLILHNIPARAQVNCQLQIWNAPLAKTSFVSKRCWETLPQAVEPQNFSMVSPAAVIENPPMPRDKPCKMKGRKRIDGECWIPRRVKLMRK